MLRQVCDESVKSARTALTLLDANFASLPTPPYTSKSMSPAAILLASQAQGDWHRSPFLCIKEIRKDVSAKLKSARLEAMKARSATVWLGKAADHLENGTPLPRAPDLIPSHIVHAIKAAKHFIKAGTLDAEPIAVALRNASLEGLGIAEEAVKSHSRYASVAQIVTTKHAATHLRRYGFEGAADRLMRKSNLRNAAHNGKLTLAKKGRRNG